jgi:hypothetical protein
VWLLPFPILPCHKPPLPPNLAHNQDVPILSAPNEKFSARYGASFNRGAGLEALTARDLSDYAELARALVARRSKLRRVRQALHAAKNSSALFDTWAFMRRYEGLLKMQWDVAFRGVRAEAAAGASGGEDGEGRGGDGVRAGGRGHAYHVVRAGAGDSPAPLHY